MKRKVSLFVVEDHAATAQALKAFLQSVGYHVTIAADVKSALKVGQNVLFDVLICDLNLPDGTGWDLMKCLSSKKPVRGIAFSAWAEAHHIARSKAAGFSQHIAKGCAPEELVGAIEKTMKLEAEPESSLVT